MNKYDIYLARLSLVKSDGSAFEEISLVLILDPSKLLVLAVKCTSHWVRQCNDYDYLIQKWSEAGLHKETVIMFDYPFNLDRSAIIRKVGRLDPYDIQWVDKLVNEIIKERELVKEEN